MKHLLFLVCALSCQLITAQELGLEGEYSKDAAKIEQELKESSMGDLLVDEPVQSKKPTPKVTANPKATKVANPAIVSADSSNSLVVEEAPVPADTDVIELPLDEDTVAITAAPDTTPVAPAVPTKISALKTIDIQAAVEGYRSPLKAAFLSLAVPGAGQVYTKKYWKTGLFVATEIAAIVGAVKFQKAGDKILADAHAIADQHYSTKKLTTFYESLYAYGISRYGATKKKELDKMIFNDLYTHDTKNDSTSVQKFIAANSNDIYAKSIANITTQGWDDAEPGFNPNATGTVGFYLSGTTDSTGLRLVGEDPFGTSVHQINYRSLLKDSEKQFSWSQGMILAIVVNHLASAADAFITANHYNRSKMEEQVESEPRVSVLSNSYLNTFGTPTTSLDVVWKF